MTDKTIFEKIRDREIPAEIIFEDDDLLVFKDIKPSAPVHVLIVPKVAHPTLESLAPGDPLHGKLLQTARQVAKQLGIADNYRLLMNVGRQVQQVPHVHLHLLGGWKDPKPL